MVQTLCMILHAHTSMQVVKKEYFSHGQPQISFNFSFKEDFVSLQIPEKGLGGWNITPYYETKVSSLLYGKVFVSLTVKTLIKAPLYNTSALRDRKLIFPAPHMSTLWPHKIF